MRSSDWARSSIAYRAGLGNGLLLGSLMYRSGLVPRRMPLLGVIGGPLSVLGATFVLFGAWDQTSATQGILTIPEIAREASLGIYLIVKGFRPSQILDDARYPQERRRPALRRLRRRVDVS